jgi:phospho-N-acetylmuramoyl-pentapeptide-transferase
MGGTVIILVVVVAYFGAKALTGAMPSISALLLLGLLVGMGAVGFVDDYIKIVRQRSLGLRSKAKFIGQTIIAVAFGWLTLQFPDSRGQSPASPAVSFIRLIDWRLPTVVVIIWVLFMVVGTSNAVNLADGLDGLATGAVMMVFGAYTLVEIWQNNQSCVFKPGPQCYNNIRDPLDLAVVAAAITGACFGFLWWNASPARIIMGDTGSLSLGGAMAGFAVMTRTELLLVVLGGLFAVITLSVILQVGYFKLTRGKRLFRMAPLHHHFELLGWAEVTIVIRFWLIAGICVAAGLGIFYAEWVVGG